MEQYSFKEQIAIMHKAKEVIAITGAGTINALFMEPEGILIDIPHRDYITKDQYKFHFYKMCNIINIEYAVFFADSIKDPEVDHYSKQDLIFNPTEFLSFYKKYISNDTIDR
jgi:capsular polysaccharide biosynthesis protein